MTTDTMTDEQVGRAWAAMMGKKPMKPPPRGSFFTWDYGVHKGRATHEIPKPLYLALLYTLYDGESEAFRVLGAALRRVWELVPRLPETPQ